MRDFGERVWTPAGSRPHVYIRLGPALDGLCEALTCGDGPVARWRPDWREITRPVERRFRHVTLAWADIPTTQAPAGSWAALAAALTETAARIAPVALTSDRLETTSHGVLLWITETPHLEQLAEAAGQAMRSVYGAAVPVAVEHHWHIALAYGRRVVDTPDLSQPTAPVTETATRILLVDNDTFSANGLRWNTGTEHDIALNTPTPAQRATPI